MADINSTAKGQTTERISIQISKNTHLEEDLIPGLNMPKRAFNCLQLCVSRSGKYKYLQERWIRKYKQNKTK